MNEWSNDSGWRDRTDGNRAARAQIYFSQPGFARMLQEVWSRYVSLEKASGHAVVQRATAEECEAINLFFGWYEKAETDILIPLAKFEQELRESAFPFTIPELHELLTGNALLTKSDRKLLAQQAWHSLFRTIVHRFVEGDVFVQQPVIGWLEGLELGLAAGYRIIRELWNSSPEEAERELMRAVQAWNMLLSGKARRLTGGSIQASVRLPVLAALAVGNPHALDRNTPAGRLLFQALRSQSTGRLKYISWAPDVDENLNAATVPDTLAAREIYRRAGILDDDISSFVHIYDPWCETRVGPYILTLRQVETVAALPPVRNIYVTENPAVFSTLADASEELLVNEAVGIGERIGPLLLCTSGPASAAALRLLDRYIEEGLAAGKLYYSGDFDVKGIEIGNVLAHRYVPHFVPWRFDSDIYEKGCLASSGQKDGLFSEEERNRLEKMHAAWDRRLCETMRMRGAKLFQEQLIAQLVEDWKCACRGG